MTYAIPYLPFVLILWGQIAMPVILSPSPNLPNMAAPRRLFAIFWRSAWLLLPLTALFWSGNVIIGRAVRDTVPPGTLSFFRWVGALGMVLLFSGSVVLNDIPAMVPRWRIMLLMSVTGISAQNTIFYFGLHSTTALNALLFQSSMPLIVLLWALALFAEWPTRYQIAGVLVSLFGVAVIAVHGDLASLLKLTVNPGDAWILTALAIYALYTVLLRLRPKVHPMSFLAGSFTLGALTLVPLVIWEFVTGYRIRGGWPSYAAIAYTALFPSFGAYLFFNRGVELIGAARAGQAVHLMPMFGSLLAVVFLGEAFRLYHLAGIVLIAAGIFLASFTGFRRGAVAALLAFALLGSMAEAQDKPADNPPSEKPPAGTALLLPEDAQPVLGREIKTQEGKVIGRLVDVLVAPDGQPRAGVVDFGGFMGVGNRRIAVAWSALSFPATEKDQPITITLSPDQIKAAPEYKSPPRPAPVVVPPVATDKPEHPAPEKLTDKPGQQQPEANPAATGSPAPPHAAESQAKPEEHP